MRDVDNDEAAAAEIDRYLADEAHLRRLRDTNPGKPTTSRRPARGKAPTKPRRPR